MKKTLSFKFRLMSLLAFAISIMVGVGVVANTYLSRVVGNYDHVVSVNMPSLRFINEARNAQRDLVILHLTPIILSDKAISDVDKLREDFKKTIGKYDSAYKALEALPPAEGELKLREAVSQSWKKLYSAATQLVDLAGANSPEDLKRRKDIADHDLATARKEYRDSFQALTDFHDAQAKQWADSAEHMAEVAKKILLWSNFAGVILALFFGLRTSRSLSTALGAISRRIAQASDSALLETQNVSSASQQMASTTTQQATSLQRTASSMEEINAMVAKNSENAQKTRSISEESQKKASSGSVVVGQMSESIDRIADGNQKIRTQFEQNNKEMADIVRVIREIEAKTKVINDIVFQTKLLSFNASVEAARAGEAGKGFAVVAEEVGNLAQMSGDAARSISEALNASTQQVEEIVKRTHERIAGLITETNARLEEGIETSQKCKEVFEAVLSNVGEVNVMAGEIAEASHEQAQGVNEVNSAIAELDTSVRSTSTASQGLSQTSDTLVGQAKGLHEIAQELFVLINGSSDPTAQGTHAGEEPRSQTPTLHLVSGSETEKTRRAA